MRIRSRQMKVGRDGDVGDFAEQVHRGRTFYLSRGEDGAESVRGKLTHSGIWGRPLHRPYEKRVSGPQEHFGRARQV